MDRKLDTFATDLYTLNETIYRWDAILQTA